MINTAAIHHNPKYWIEGYDETKHQNVNMFDIHTEFWLDEDGAFVKKRQSDHFFTFHSGKRDCPGQALAMKELIIVLAMVFMKYTVEETVDVTATERIEWKLGGAGIIEPKESLVLLKHRE